MRKFLCAICVSLLAASAVQAQQSISLDLPAGGPDPHLDGASFTTSVTDGGGATYDIVYTLNAFATDETNVDAFIKTNGQGTFFGVGSAPDGANTGQQESVDGGDGERLSISNLSITNFVAGSDGLVAGDLSIAFGSITIFNGTSTQDGVNFSYADFDVDTANANRPGRVLDDGTIPVPAQVDLTALANYDAASTSLFIAPDNIANSNRWSISEITVLVTGGTASPDALLGDANLDGMVNFLDISPFISLLSSGTFLAQADTNEDGAVSFLDIAPFISILSGS